MALVSDDLSRKEKNMKRPGTPLGFCCTRVTWSDLCTNQGLAESMAGCTQSDLCTESPTGWQPSRPAVTEAVEAAGVWPSPGRISIAHCFVQNQVGAIKFGTDARPTDLQGPADSHPAVSSLRG